ncbi:phosphotriesterase [Muricomes intestini]|uniref:phosphotriesterase family protein n=1 Tax=Muricomes intestini TaxID=1796634 RepID=UPI002FDD7BA2
MKEIVTVTGPIAPEELGFCQCHEHIAMSKGKSWYLNPALRIDDMAKSLEEVRRYKSCGGDSFIDAQPCGCNRMAEELRKLSVKSGVHIIASTGFHKLCFYPDSHWIHFISEAELEEVFVRELTTGMYTDADCTYPSVQSSVKAGIIKTAYDTEELSPRYKKLFRAAASASLKAERIIMIHVEQDTNPILLQDFLLNLGMQPENLMFCHMDRACKDIRIHEDVLKKGSYLEFDTIGRFKYHSDEHEIQIIQSLVDIGYATQLLYSLDTTSDRLMSYNPDAIGLNYILTKFNASLKSSGISEDIIHMLSIENPARILTQ